MKENPTKSKMTREKDKSKVEKVKIYIYIYIYIWITQQKQKKIQLKIDNNEHLGQTLLLFDSIGKSAAIDSTASDFGNTNEKVKKIKRLICTGEYDADIARYTHVTLQLMSQVMLDRIDIIEQPAHISYKDKETFDFQLLLDENLYTNLNSLHLCFSTKF